MLCINDHHTDPYFNLAAEEYVLKNFEENCFMLWRNEPSVIVGRHQNTLAEINVDYVKQNDIKVVRRLSGGGAVFHDLGNINFTFIENKESDKLIDFHKYTKPIIDVLQQLEVDARFEGRNDLVIDGKKFSGNAEHVYRNSRILHHGTLLFSAELSDLSGALNANPTKFNDKAIKSVRSRVTNISSHLKEPIGLEQFRELVFDHMMNSSPDCRAYQYSDKDLSAIQQLRDEKYATWEWDFGQSPGYNMINGVRTGGGHLEIHLDVQNGIIQHIRIFGDFFNIREISELETMLTGVPHHEENIRKMLKSVNLSDYLVNISENELISVMF
ncbi:MAG: lipoate--protein ligase [Bacteroidales bacterium]|jgi:lipoate-protein ligase A|nr:lipoate--protein ligase [Bacteroidales bacterium]